jgi:hypothetical protein
LAEKHLRGACLPVHHVAHKALKRFVLNKLLVNVGVVLQERFMTQVYGRKRIKLISSDALHLVYNFESFFSEVDAEQPDTDRYPLFAKAEIIEVTMEPGEALLIPVGWWHHVRSLDISVNISLTNFLFPNDFENCYSSSS